MFLYPNTIWASKGTNTIYQVIHTKLPQEDIEQSKMSLFDQCSFALAPPLIYLVVLLETQTSSRYTHLESKYLILPRPVLRNHEVQNSDRLSMECFLNCSPNHHANYLSSVPSWLILINLP